MKVKGLVKERVCIIHRHGQRCGDDQREESRARKEGGKGGGMVMSAIVSTVK